MRKRQHHYLRITCPSLLRHVSAVLLYAGATRSVNALLPDKGTSWKIMRNDGCLSKRRPPQRLAFLCSKEPSIFFESEEVLNSSTIAFTGAVSPRPELPPEDIPSLLMRSLKNNDVPYKDAGLVSMWEFASDTTRHVFQNNITDFIQSAHETAEEWPTSLYGAAMHGQAWCMETPLNRVGDSCGSGSGSDGSWIATQVMTTVSSDGRVRRWQWELRKHRRPPHLGNWYVESIGSSDRKGNFEAED